MGGSKTSLGFLVLLPIVLFSGTSSGEFGDNPAQAVVMGGGRGVGREIAWAMTRKGDGGGVRGVSRNFLQGGAAAPTSFPSLAHLVLGGSSRLLAGSPAHNRDDLSGVVVPGIWEVTLRDEGAGTRQEIGLKPPPPRVQTALGSGSPGAPPVGHPAGKRPRPAPKSTPSRPDLCNRDPSGPYISRPLKDQRSFPAVSYKRRADPGAQEAAAAHSRLKRA